MGSGGTEWDIDDIPTADRLNQKTTFVGTGAEIDALGAGDTFPGQRAVCTTDGSGFIANIVYKRNAADDGWILDTVLPDDSDYPTPLSGVVIPIYHSGVGKPLYGLLKNSTTEPTRYVENDKTLYHYIDDDFSAYSSDANGNLKWQGNESGNGVDSANDELDFSTTTGIDPELYFDLGGTVSETEWVLRIYQINFSTLTLGTANHIHIGLSDNISNGSSSQDFIGIDFRYATGPNIVVSSTDAEATSIAADTDTGFDHVTSTDYWIEIKRLSATSYSVEVFSDAFSTSLTSGPVTGTITSGVNALRYIKITDWSADGGEQTGTIQRIAFKDGQSSW